MLERLEYLQLILLGLLFAYATVRLLSSRMIAETKSRDEAEQLRRQLQSQTVTNAETVQSLRESESKYREYKNLQNALTDTQDRLTSLVRTVPDVIYEVDAQGKFTFISDAIRQFGYGPEELVGRHFSQIIHPEDLARVSRETVLPLCQGKATGDTNAPKLFDERRTGARATRGLELRLVLKNPVGSEDFCHVEVNSSGKWDRDVKAPDKRFLGSIGTIHSVHARKKSREAMEYRMEFERIITTLSTHLINLTPEKTDAAVNQTLQAVGEFLDADRAYVFLFEEAGQLMNNTHEWCGQDVTPQIKDLQTLRPALFPYTMTILAKHEPMYIPDINGLPEEYQIEKRYWQERGVKTLICLPMVLESALYGFFGLDLVKSPRQFTEDDISLLKIVGEILTNALARKRNQEALRSANERLQETRHQLFEAEKMEIVGRLASGVAHEVKNPLATILMGTDFLSIKLKSTEETVTITLADMREAVKRADNIIKGLLDFASVSRLDRMPYDLNSVIENALVLLKHQFDLYHAKVFKDLKVDLPYITVDKNRLEQVFINLLLNAAQAVPENTEGTLTVKSSTDRIGHDRPQALTPDENNDFREGDKVLIAMVENNGPAITPDVMKRIFDPFFTTKRDKGGSGLGLSIVKNIIEMHGGRIIIENMSALKGVRATIVFKVE